MKVGVVGSGDVGRTLGEGFAAHGHDVKIGTRNSDKSELKEGKARVGAKGPFDIGGFDGSRWLEAPVPLWVRLAIKFGTWNVAFKVLRS